MPDKKIAPTSTHWGNFRIETQDKRITQVLPYEVDIEPSVIGQSLLDNSDPNVRIAQPMVRQGYLQSPAGPSDGGARKRCFRTR